MKSLSTSPVGSPYLNNLTANESPWGDRLGGCLVLRPTYIRIGARREGEWDMWNSPLFGILLKQRKEKSGSLANTCWNKLRYT